MCMCKYDGEESEENEKENGSDRKMAELKNYTLYICIIYYCDSFIVVQLLDL